MIQNNPQIWSKKSYTDSNYLWQEDSFIRKSYNTNKPGYLIDEVYEHGLSTHLFDRNNGIYTYFKKKIDTTSLNKKEDNNETNLQNNSTIQNLPTKWKPSIKKSNIL